jgi:predicted nucleic acid-binding protein
MVEAELLVHPLRHGSEDALDRVSTFLADKSVRLIHVDRPLAREAAVIRAKHNLTLVDSVIVATAVVSGCDALIGNDKRCASRVTEIPYIYLEEAAKA